MQGPKGPSGAPVVRKTWQIPPRPVAGRQNSDRTTRTGNRSCGASGRGSNPVGTLSGLPSSEHQQQWDGVDRTEPLMHAASDSGGRRALSSWPHHKQHRIRGGLESPRCTNLARAYGTTALGEGSGADKGRGTGSVSGGSAQPRRWGVCRRAHGEYSLRSRAQWGDPTGPRAVRQLQGAEAAAKGVEGLRRRRRQSRGCLGLGAAEGSTLKVRCLQRMGAREG